MAVGARQDQVAAAGVKDNLVIHSRRPHRDGAPVGTLVVDDVADVLDGHRLPCEVQGDELRISRLLRRLHTSLIATLLLFRLHGCRLEVICLQWHRGVLWLQELGLHALDLEVIRLQWHGGVRWLGLLLHGRLLWLRAQDLRLRGHLRRHLVLWGQRPGRIPGDRGRNGQTSVLQREACLQRAEQAEEHQERIARHGLPGRGRTLPGLWRFCVGGLWAWLRQWLRRWLRRRGASRLLADLLLFPLCLRASAGTLVDPALARKYPGEDVDRDAAREADNDGE
mmetsp:Transcript_85707/g.227739  ORF Transcript_85707/g.227739 Transcript_85707/m.227739 type:complete len:281 (-) Transcript_85707:151-993(-)